MLYKPDAIDTGRVDTNLKEMNISEFDNEMIDSETIKNFLIEEKSEGPLTPIPDLAERLKHMDMKDILDFDIKDIDNVGTLSEFQENSDTIKRLPSNALIHQSCSPNVKSAKLHVENHHLSLCKRSTQIIDDDQGPLERLQ